MKELIFKEECYQIQGTIFEVYREMGNGFLEAVYQKCLEMELSRRCVPFISQHQLRLTFRGQPLNQTYKVDLICYDKIVVELKALTSTTPQRKAQLMNYLKSSRLSLGLLVNFGSFPKATVERIIR